MISMGSRSVVFTKIHSRLGLRNLSVPFRQCALSASTAHASDGVRSEVDMARVEASKDIAWAKTRGAAEVLRQPQFAGTRGSVGGDALKSLDAYLQARRWRYPPDTPARRFLSHILTYPLTLAAGLKETNPRQQDRLSVVCIGARAEGSLPPSLWLETLIALPKLRHLDLHLLGPEVAVPLRLPTAVGVRSGDGADSRAPGARDGTSARVNLNLSGERTVDISWIRATLGAAGAPMPGGQDRQLGEAKRDTAGSAASPGSGTLGRRPMEREAMEKAVRGADAFVLFNPGLGHPHLRRGWEPAAKRLLASGVPMVVTCHSPNDLQRDHEQLNAIGRDYFGDGWEREGRGALVSPRKNVFGSLRQTEDPLGEPGTAELVSPNWGMLVVGAGR